MVIINRRDCAAYRPLNQVFTFVDGSEYSLRKIPLPPPIPYELACFIFAHWWPGVTPEDAESGMQKQIPKFESRCWIFPPVVVLLYVLLSDLITVDIGESILIPFVCVPVTALSLIWICLDLWNPIKTLRARRAYRFDLTREPMIAVPVMEEG